MNGAIPPRSPEWLPNFNHYIMSRPPLHTRERLPREVDPIWGIHRDVMYYCIVSVTILTYMFWQTWRRRDAYFCYPLAGTSLDLQLLNILYDRVKQGKYKLVVSYQNKGFN